MWIVRTKDSSVLGFYLPDSDYIGAVKEIKHDNFKRSWTIQEF